MYSIAPLVQYSVGMSFYSCTLYSITGKFRKSVIRDISVALGIGTVFGYGYWWGLHLPAG